MDVESKPNDCMKKINQFLHLEVPPMNEGHLVVGIWGSIRQDAVPGFKSEMMNIIMSEMLVKLTLDFTRVDFIDSQGLAVIYEMFLALKDKGAAFEIINASSNISNLFLLTRLHQLFTIR